MTEESRQTLPADSEASLRETLRAKIDGAQAQLAANLAQLRSAIHADSGLIAQGDAQLSALVALQGQIDTANPMALAMLSAAITASVANASTLAQQVNDAATATSREAAAQQLAAADKAARASVASFEKDYYERRIFDPYLRFGSKEEEEAFREREAERQRAIAEARAKGTPAGDLRALDLSIAQTEDAGAHGASASSSYQPMLDGMRSARTQLAQQFSNRDKATDQQANTAPVEETKEVAASTSVSPDLIASFRAAGVAVAEQNAEGHGVTARDPASTARGLA